LAPGKVFVIAFRHAGFIGKLKIRLPTGPIRAWLIAIGLTRLPNDLWWRPQAVELSRQSAKRRLRPLLAPDRDRSERGDGCKTHKHAQKHVVRLAQKGSPPYSKMEHRQVRYGSKATTMACPSMSAKCQSRSFCDIRGTPGNRRRLYLFKGRNEDLFKGRNEDPYSLSAVQVPFAPVFCVSVPCMCLPRIVPCHLVSK
jgi:hypothetical protein